MNICLVIISDVWGGGENVAYKILKNLEDTENNIFLILNHEIFNFYKDLKHVKILDIGYVYDWKWLISNIFSFQKIKSDQPSNEFFIGTEYICEFLRPLYFIKIKRVISDFIVNNSIDIMHSHLENSDILVSLIKNPRTPIITTIHGQHLPSLVNEISSRTLLWFKIYLLMNALKKMDFITAVSRWQLDRMKQVVRIENRSKVIYNGIDPKSITKYSGEKMQIKGDFKILFPGGDNIMKGTYIVIEAIEIAKRRISGIHLYVAGPKSKKDLARKKVHSRALEDNVTICGSLPYEQYFRLLSSIDLLCLPAHQEAFSMVLLEAMAFGKPIVACNSGGIPELVENGKNGILVNRTAENVANAILTFYENDELRNSIIMNNMKHANDFDWKEIVGEYLAIYSKIIASHGN